MNGRSGQQRLAAAVLFAVLLALWEALPALGLADPFFVSSPSRIIESAKWLFAHGFWNDIAVSLVEYAWGMLLAITAGVLLGWTLGWYKGAASLVEPYLTVFNAAPRVALLPLLILWLGIGIESKIAAVFLGAFFPIVFTVMKGGQIVDSTLVQLARSFGAADVRLFTTLVIPSSVPFIVAGLQIAVGRGLVGVVIGEIFAARAGVGHMMALAAASFQTDKVFVGLLILTGFGLVLTEVIKLAERQFESWRL